MWGLHGARCRHNGVDLLPARGVLCLHLACLHVRCLHRACIGTGWGGLGRAWGRPTRASTVGHKSSDLAALLYVTNQMGVQVFCVGQQWGNQVGVPRHPCSSELKASVPAGGDGPWAVLGYTFLPGFPARRAAVDLTPQRLPLTAAAVSPPELSGTSVTPLCGHVTGVIPRLGGHKEP